MRLLQPSSFLVSAGSVRHDAVLALKQGQACLLQEKDLPSGVSVERFPGELWTAPPLLFHAHLESFDAPSSSWPSDSFSSWAESLLSWRSAPGRLSAASSAEASWKELRHAGCGAVLSSMSEPGATPLLPASSSAPYCQIIPELFAPDPNQLETVYQTLSADLQGIALHAPYSVSEALARKSFEWMKSKQGRVLSIHLGEHAEEREFLRDRSGPLADLLQSRGRAGKSQRWNSPVDWLDDVAPGSIPGTIAVHCGDLDTEELKRLEKKRVQVVWCPGTHQYFERPRPDFPQAGMDPPLLGCDSRASNPALDPLREVRIARKVLPDYGPVEWWRSLTERAIQAWPWASSQPKTHDHKPAWISTFGHLPLRFSDPGLPSARDVCDYLTSESNLSPIAPVGIPAPLK